MLTETTPKGQRFCSVDGPDSHSPGIEPFGGNVEIVTVDGVEIDPKRVYYASEPGGFVNCYKENKNGRKYVVIDEDGEEEIAREQFFGVVEIRLEGEAA